METLNTLLDAFFDLLPIVAFGVVFLTYREVRKIRKDNEGPKGGSGLSM